MLNKKILLSFAVFSATVLTVLATDPNTVKTFNLSNGMEVWLNEDHTLPTVIGMVVVKAGAKDCPDTGIAHYFEHIMFKGTERIGTVDYEQEKPWLDSIRMEYGILARTTDETERAEIQKRINRLSVEAARYAVPNEFSNLVSLFGGSMLNAGTGLDETSYFNIFSSNNIVPWLELNSERFIDPVFRLFQSELETVYEEKNMYSDQFIMGAVEKLQEIVFDPHPYGKSILGTTENLKNPDLDAMEEFFRTYYVAGNMALILCGDFDSESVMPEIERTFGSLPAGGVAREEKPAPRPFSGRETERVLVPIPLIQAGATLWRAMEQGHPDGPIMDIALRLLSNSNGTGYLDELSEERKVMGAAAFTFSLQEAGIIAAAYIPKSLVSGLKKAESYVLEQVERLKRGDFTDQQLSQAVMEYRKEQIAIMEDYRSKVFKMSSIYTSGQTWDEYLERLESLESLTREDVVRVVNKYLGGDMLSVSKKTGRYPKDMLEKPGFEPVLPDHDITESRYARELKEKYLNTYEPRVIDFDKDFETVGLSGGNRLFVTRNPYNDIFSLTVTYPVGTKSLPAAEFLPLYLENTAAGETTNIEFRKKLRELDSELSFDVNEDSFMITLEGFDRNFVPSFDLMTDFLNDISTDKDAFDKVLSFKSIEEMSTNSSADALDDALTEYVLYRDESSYKRTMSRKELKKYGAAKLVGDYKAITGHEASVHYAGTLASAQVKEVIENHIDGTKPADRRYIPYRESGGGVYLLNYPSSRQSNINLLIVTEPILEIRDRYLATLFNMYLGGSMNSVLFREVREFRSLGYSTGSQMSLARRKNPDQRGAMQIYLTTQTDKTEEALDLLDSLLSNMAIDTDRFEQAKIQLINNINNGYPPFRYISRRAVRSMDDGYDHDPNADLAQALNEIMVEDLVSFYERFIKERPISVSVLTDTRKVKPAILEKYGTVVKVKRKDIIK